MDDISHCFLGGFNSGPSNRLGKRRTVFMTDDSILKKLYGDHDGVDERHRWVDLQLQAGPGGFETKLGMKIEPHLSK